MATEFEASGRRSVTGCGAALVVFLTASCGFGLYSCGDRDPSYAVTIENRTPRVLAIGFSEGSGVVNGDVLVLPPGTKEFYQAFLRVNDGPDRISVYRSKSDTTRRLCGREVSKDIEDLDDRRSRLIVEPVGVGCRIDVVANTPPASR